ncbi:MAG TPA: metal-sulfur cluster assembly factor [bacterium]|nr:metal-sulfur cluster assembly factor [bacterium]
MITAAEVEDALRGVDDPEIGINVVDLGLVYGVRVEGDAVEIDLTMTSPACPLGAYLEEQVQAAVREAAPEAGEVRVALVWDPPWGPERMSPAAKRELGWKP